MRGKSRWWVGVGLACYAIVACGQELVIPTGKPPGASAGAAPREGFTGVGGVEDEAGPSARLPIAGEPIFTTFGGAGGERGDESAGAASPVPMTPRKVGGGGRPGDDGASGSSGGKSAGGSSGGKSAGGSSGGKSASGSSGGEADAGAAGAPSLPAALLFSEYLEGSGSFKALEIYALEASSLDDCELQTYSNGKLAPSRLALHGQLASGELLVLCSASLANAQPQRCGRSTNLIFNGDDALALSCAGRLLDVIGQVGVDPGDSWGMGATLDHTLRRRCEVATGRHDGSLPFEIEAEWLTLGVDTFTDLGVRNCAP